jgi:hypothetical protein
LSKAAEYLLDKTTKLKMRFNISKVKKQCYSLSTASLVTDNIMFTSSKNFLLFSDLILDKETVVIETLLLFINNYLKNELYKVKQILEYCDEPGKA